RRRGIRLWAEGGRLRYDAPAGALDDDLRAALAAQREPLLEVLSGKVNGTHAPLRALPRGESLPLSFGQQRLWFLHQLSPDDVAYTVPAAVRLKGRLDPTALSRAIGEIVRRHETLRSRFPSVDGKATLIIERYAPVALRVESLESSSEEERLAEVTRLCKED